MDIGQPKDFITGASLYLDHIKTSAPEKLAEGAHLKSPVLIVSKNIDYIPRSTISLHLMPCISGHIVACVSCF